LDAVEATSSILEHVHLVEGPKWYGMHIGNFKTPARENDPRHMPPNFYYDQQDLITECQKGKQWSWSASRPCFLIDFAPNRPRNVVSVIGAYAAICRELGIPLNFPGTDTCWNSLSEATDARQLARAMVFLSTCPKARNEAFNVTNGDLFRWKHLWPRIARLFDMPCGDVQTLPLGLWMADKDPIWERIVRQHKLKPRRLAEVALWAFGDFVFRQSCDVFTPESGHSSDASSPLELFGLCDVPAPGKWQSQCVPSHSDKEEHTYVTQAGLCRSSEGAIGSLEGANQRLSGAT